MFPFLSVKPAESFSVVVTSEQYARCSSVRDVQVRDGQLGRVRADADLLAPQLDLRVPRRAGAALQGLRRRLRRPVPRRRRQRPPTQGAPAVRPACRTPRQGRRQVSSFSHNHPTFISAQSRHSPTSSQHSLFIFGHTRSPIHIIFSTNNRSFLPVCFSSSLKSTSGFPPSTTH